MKTAVLALATLLTCTPAFAIFGPKKTFELKCDNHASFLVKSVRIYSNQLPNGKYVSPVGLKKPGLLEPEFLLENVNPSAACSLENVVFICDSGARFSLENIKIFTSLTLTGIGQFETSQVLANYETPDQFDFTDATRNAVCDAE